MYLTHKFCFDSATCQFRVCPFKRDKDKAVIYYCDRNVYVMDENYSFLYEKNSDIDVSHSYKK